MVNDDDDDDNKITEIKDHYNKKFEDLISIIDNVILINYYYYGESGAFTMKLRSKRKHVVRYLPSATQHQLIFFNNNSNNKQ